MAIGRNGATVSMILETAGEFNIAEEIKNKVEKELLRVINDCSTEFYRNIKAEIKITLE